MGTVSSFDDELEDVLSPLLPHEIKIVTVKILIADLTKLFADIFTLLIHPLVSFLKEKTDPPSVIILPRTKNEN